MPEIIVLTGIIGDTILPEDVRAGLQRAAGKDVRFEVNSPGGLVFASIEIFNLIKDYPGHVEVRNVGLMASGASYFPLAADKVTAFENTAYMIHNARGLVFGDHFTMRDVADRIESLSGIFVKEYSKKSEQPHGTIVRLMKDETFYFGKEMLDAGFIDEILKSPESDDRDKETALIEARASIEMCHNQLQNTEAANNDFNEAVAYMDTMSKFLEDPILQTTKTGDELDAQNRPAGAGNINEEDKRMTLTELLAADPVAKAEYDAAMAKARTEGETVARDEIKVIVAKVQPILESPDYSGHVKVCGIKAITGEGEVAAFEAVVVMADVEIEAKKEAAAKLETKKTPETKANGGGATADAEAKAKFEARKKSLEYTGV